MRIECDGVGQFKTHQFLLALSGQRGNPAVSRIDMKPHLLRSTNVRNLRQCIDGSCVGCPRIGGNGPGKESEFAIFVHEPFDIAPAQPESMVYRYGSNLFRMQSDHFGGPVDGPMALLSHVKHRSRPVVEGQTVTGHD